MNQTSLRYGGGIFDARSNFIRLCGLLQKKKVVILSSNPGLCGEILAASDTKGTFLEHIFATSAWHPIYSIESMDGMIWEKLAQAYRKVIGQIQWRERLSSITQKNVLTLKEKLKVDPQLMVDSESLTRLVSKIMFELLFETPISAADETLFYQASIEWRKEIAIKGKGSSEIKNAFWARLTQVIEVSKFKDDLKFYSADPAIWVSVFAQPFLISPQINISDIMVAVFQLLRADPKRLKKARRWATFSDKNRLSRIILESIRLRHPFPILERELKQDRVIQGKLFKSGTQFFILYDQFQQDQTFDPERWLQASSDNPYASMPFAAGPRMCIGKPIAMELLVDLLRAFLTEFPDEKVQPQHGHLYSGRDNDGKQSLTEIAYQTQVFGRGLWKSFLIGHARKTIGQGCPFKMAREKLL